MATTHDSPPQIGSQSMLPDVLAHWPQTRAVFNRYGLSGCGGRRGPVESIQFFARTHGIEEQQLMAELRQAIANPSMAVPSAAGELADTLYRRYFLAGIVLILTAGATWGAWLLWKIGFAHSFTSNSIHAVNAHGSAQIFGWVGLFIMGFAYQAFPRLWHATLVAPRLAVVAFGLMLTSLVVGTAGMTLAEQWRYAATAALAGGILSTVAIVTFATQIVLTFRCGDGRLEPYVGFVLMALVWFVTMSIASAWHTWMTMTAPDRQRLLWYVATYQAPLRDLQIHGLAMFMILGVSMRMLPALFEVPALAPRRAWAALAVLTAGVVGEAVLFVAYRWSGNHALAGLLMLPWILLAAGVWMVAGPWRLWRHLPVRERSAKFVRAAYGWLAISLLMLLALPLYQWVSGIAFSHAYYGAIRHAITVGFISLMIMGFAAKVVPTLNGIDTHRLSALWGPFVLVNVGCFLRVSVQTLTDWYSGAFWVVGVSGTLEVAALAWWGGGLVRIMRAGKRQMNELEIEESRPPRIHEQHKVADVLAWFPSTAPVFDRFGFTPLRNPVLRRTVGKVTSVRQAAAHKSLPVEQLVAALNEAAQTSQSAQAPRADPPLVQLSSPRKLAAV